MAYVYTEKMLFLDSEEGESEGWTTDCGGKKDFDPVIVHISSRVYRDGTYIQTVIVGGDETISDTGILHANNATEARLIVEQEAEKHADRIITAVRDAYRIVQP